MGLKKSDLKLASMLSHTINQNFKPDKVVNYFGYYNREKHEKIVAVILPFFNEEDYDMMRTLKSLYKQEKECEELGFKFVYLAIMDGWDKASDSMKNYFLKVYPGCWPEQIENSKNEIETHILERKGEKSDMGNDIHMDFSLLIKKDNRKKANSHEWFFNAFAKDLDVDYTFATDCGTLFKEECLFNLLEYIERHSEVSGVTGRQRVMSQEQQGIEYEGYKGMLYRAGQAYDYEASISSFQGAFSLFGCLPVLPGPCGLYRYSDIKGECLDYYFDVVNNHGPESGLIMGNLLLAEDRILSFAASLKTGKFTRWVPGSIFYFEAETRTRNFITQRRRWTNGALAGYIYLVITNPGIIWRSKHTFFFRLTNYILLLFQLLSFIFTGISPGIFMALGSRSIKELELLPEEINEYTSYVLSGIYFTLFLTFIFIHFRNKFVNWIYDVIMTVNIVVYLFVMASFIKIIFLGDPIIISLLVISLFVPFILAILHSIDVFAMMLVNFIPFLLFLPTFIPWFVTYAYTRTWDLTWGNRPSQLMDDVENKKDKDTIQRNLKIKGFLIVVFLILANAGMLVVLNMFEYGFIIYISASFLLLALIQQFLSFIYFIFKTDHLLLSSFNKIDRRIIKAGGIVLMLIAFSFITTGLFTSHWLVETKTFTQHLGTENITIPINITNTTTNTTILVNTTETINITKSDTVDLAYGIMFISIKYYNNTYKSETTTWGSNILYDWPNSIWTIVFSIVFFVFLFLVICIISIFNGICQKDQSRTKHIVTFYLLSSCILLIIAMVLFPFGFEDMNSYKLNWLEIPDMCGNSSTYYLDTCKLDWSFYLFITGSLLLIIGYNTIKFSEIKQRYQKTIGGKTYKFLPSRANSMNPEDIREIEDLLEQGRQLTENYKSETMSLKTQDSIVVKENFIEYSLE